MPLEISLFDAYVPAIFVIMIIAGLITLLLDPLLARIGLYDAVWHPSLFRVSLFVCLLCTFGLMVYR